VSPFITVGSDSFLSLSSLSASSLSRRPVYLAPPDSPSSADGFPSIFSLFSPDSFFEFAVYSFDESPLSPPSAASATGVFLDGLDESSIGFGSAGAVVSADLAGAAGVLAAGVLAAGLVVVGLAVSEAVGVEDAGASGVLGSDEAAGAEAVSLAAGAVVVSEAAGAGVTVLATGAVVGSLATGAVLDAVLLESAVAAVAPLAVGAGEDVVLAGSVDAVVESVAAGAVAAVLLVSGVAGVVLSSFVALNALPFEAATGADLI